MNMFRRSTTCLYALIFAIATWTAEAQQEGATPPIAKSQLSVQKTDLRRAAFPVVDVHTHFFVKGKHDADLLEQYVAMMDRNNIAVCVSLDATLFSRLEQHRDFLWTNHKDRFVLFANIDFQGGGEADATATWSCNQPDFVRNIVEQIRRAHTLGVISGLKFFKDFGLRYRNADGTLVAIDDPRWGPIWAVCGELRLPIIMHTADPGAFFEPITPANERFFELNIHPNWSFSGARFPSRKSLHEARNRVVAQYPQTTFIAAHFGNDGENLDELSQWMTRYPNLVIEFASRINELGRQPYSTSRFFETYQDRILFGTDGPWPEARLRIYWRFLETKDEYFDYSEKTPPPQGDWRIYGLGLDPNVLQKVYSLNAERIIPGVRERVAKYQAKNTGR